MATNKKSETSYIEDMEVEFDELQEKRVKVEKFLISDKMQNCNSQEVDLLKEQKNVMDEYSNILAERIRIAKMNLKLDKMNSCNCDQCETLCVMEEC